MLTPRWAQVAIKTEGDSNGHVLSTAWLHKDRTGASKPERRQQIVQVALVVDDNRDDYMEFKLAEWDGDSWMTLGITKLALETYKEWETATDMYETYKFKIHKNIQIVNYGRSGSWIMEYRPDEGGIYSNNTSMDFINEFKCFYANYLDVATMKNLTWEEMT